MRALYGANDGVRKLPALLHGSEMQVKVGSSPSTKANFTHNYNKLRENTKLKKKIEQTETMQPFGDPNITKSVDFLRKLSSKDQVIVGLQKKLD